MSVVARWQEIKERIAQAATNHGREVSEVQLMAVTKTYPAEVIAEVVSEGQLLLGENRVQELLEKYPHLASDVKWHLIGPLQRNKVRKVVGLCDCLQTVDSLKLAQAISRVGSEEAVTQNVLLQLRIGGEESKSGFDAATLFSEFEELLSLPNLEIDGVMTIPPPVKEASEARRYFAEAREIRDQLSQRGGLPLPQLSMGMSGDFEAAISEGSTMVRVGSAIFGSR